MTYFIREGDRSINLQRPSTPSASKFISIKHPHYLDTITSHIFSICPWRKGTQNRLQTLSTFCIITSTFSNNSSNNNCYRDHELAQLLYEQCTCITKPYHTMCIHSTTSHMRYGIVFPATTTLQTHDCKGLANCVLVACRICNIEVRMTQVWMKWGLLSWLRHQKGLVL